MYGAIEKHVHLRKAVWLAETTIPLAPTAYMLCSDALKLRRQLKRRVSFAEAKSSFTYSDYLISGLIAVAQFSLIDAARNNFPEQIVVTLGALAACWLAGIVITERISNTLSEEHKTRRDR